MTTKSKTYRGCLIVVEETTEGFDFIVEGSRCTFPQGSEGEAFEAAMQEIDEIIDEDG